MGRTLDALGERVLALRMRLAFGEVHAIAAALDVDFYREGVIIRPQGTLRE